MNTPRQPVDARRDGSARSSLVATDPPFPPRTNGRGLKTREAIVQAAIAVLRDAGYANFSLQQVTSRLGISLGNLTYHFPARTDLVAAMVDRLLSEHSARLEGFCGALCECGSADLTRIVDWLFDDAVDPTTSTVLPELWAMANHDPAVARELDRVHGEAISRLMEVMGLEPHAPANAAFRSALFLLSNVVKGCTAVFGRSGAADQRFITTRLLTKTVLMPVLQDALEQALRARA